METTHNIKLLVWYTRLDIFCDTVCVSVLFTGTTTEREEIVIFCETGTEPVELSWNSTMEPWMDQS